MDVIITREPDDGLAETRISLGTAAEVDGLYMVFRGEPDKVIKTLTTALAVAQYALPAGRYVDKRGRPQG